MLAQIITASALELPPLERVWGEAVQEYTAKIRKAGQHVDLERWKHVRDVDDLITRLESEHGAFDWDVGRGSTLTSALKAGFAPMTLLMNMLGGPASAASAPCSQIFGAVTVLISAGKKTGAAFDDIAGLFKDLGQSTQLLKPLTKRSPPPQLEAIIRGMLVCLLTICALATKRTCHVPQKTKHRSFKQVFSGVHSNVAEFGRQLFFGEDAEIGAAKANLQALSESQAQLVAVLTFEKVGDLQENIAQFGVVTVDMKNNTARMESAVVDIQGLTVEVSSAIVELRTDVTGIKIQLKEIGSVVSRVDFKVDEIRENMLTKADQKESLTLFNDRFDRLQQMPAPAKAELSETAAMHSKRLKQLKLKLKPQSANRNFYKRIADNELIQGTGDWILERPQMKDWVEGSRPVLCVEGDAGYGKTFLAARVVKYLLETHSQGVQSPSAIFVAFFFAKKELPELTSVRHVLSTISFQLAQNDRVYASYIDAKTKEVDLDECEIEALWTMLFRGYYTDARGTAFLVLEAVEECDDDDIEAFLGALKSTACAESQAWPNDLRLLLMHHHGLLRPLHMRLITLPHFSRWNTQI